MHVCYTLTVSTSEVFKLTGNLGIGYKSVVTIFTRPRIFVNARCACLICSLLVAKSPLNMYFCVVFNRTSLFCNILRISDKCSTPPESWFSMESKAQRSLSFDKCPSPFLHFVLKSG